MRRPTRTTTSVTALTAALAASVATPALGGTTPQAASAAPAATTGAAAHPRAAAVTPARVAGPDRAATAAEIAALGWPAGASTAVVARADDFPDALAAPPLAGQADAPVLLAFPDRLPAVTRDALASLGVSDVYVVGGTDAISPAVEQEIREAGYAVTRVAGPDRYATAAAVARETVRLGEINRLVGRDRTAFLALGTDFRDALAAGPAAASEPEIPVLLTTGVLPAATEQAIRDLDVEFVYIVGGPLAVTETVREQLEAMGVGVRRLSGQTASGTAAAIAREFVAPGKLGGETVVLATGDDFADALAAGPYAGRAGAPVLLTEGPLVLGEATEGYLQDPPTPVEVVRAAGGTAALAPSTLSAAVEAAESAAPPDAPTGQTFLVAPQEALTAPVPGTVQFRVLGRYDDAPLPDTLDVALFPCADVDAVGGGPVTFRDADGNGLADGFGDTDTGNAAIATLNGEDIADQKVLYDAIVRDGQVVFQVAAVAGGDCTVPVVFTDDDGDGMLAVGGTDVGEVATEPFGVGKVTFTAG